MTSHVRNSRLLLGRKPVQGQPELHGILSPIKRKERKERTKQRGKGNAHHYVLEFKTDVCLFHFLFIHKDSHNKWTRV